MPPRTLQVMGQVHSDPLVARRQRARCTDALCCLIFVLAFLAMLALGAAGVYYGDQAALVRLARGRDLHGRVCGKDPEVKKFPLAYFTLSRGSIPPAGNWTMEDRSRLKVVCTSKCPETIAGELHKPVVVREADNCPPDAYPEWCTWYGGNTTRLADYCVDLEVFDLGLPWQHWLQDLRASWKVLVAVPLMAILLGFVFLCFVDRWGALCIWITLGLSVVVPVAFGTWLFLGARNGAGSRPENMNMSPDTRKDIAYSLWGFAALVVLLSCCFMGTLRGIINVLKTTSQFLEHVPSQMVQPVFIGLAQLIVFGLWLVLFVQVASIGVEEGDSTKCLSLGDIYCLKWNSHAQFYGLAYLVVMLYWLVNFLHALSHFGTSYAVGAWYFAPVDPVTGRKEPEEGGRGLCDCRLSVRALCHGLARHSGSLAFGSFVISLAQLGRLLLWWAKKGDEARILQNPISRCVRRCVDCLADCFTRFIQFVSEHAYVEIALTGEGFWSSAKKGASLAVLRPALFALVGRVACAVRLLGTAVITAGSAYVVVLLLLCFPVDGLASTNVPVVTAALGGFIVSQVMMHPFSTAARACLHCLCLDEGHTRALGMPGGAQHTPQRMQLLVEQHSCEEQARGCCSCCR